MHIKAVFRTLNYLTTPKRILLIRDYGISDSELGLSSLIVMQITNMPQNIFRTAVGNLFPSSITLSLRSGMRSVATEQEKPSV